METALLDIEATAEEIQDRLTDFAGQRLRVIVWPVENSPQSSVRKPSITEALLEMAQEIPSEERAKLPSDLAEQHDHYIYGWPKK